jgi:hypothetical protein
MTRLRTSSRKTSLAILFVVALAVALFAVPAFAMAWTVSGNVKLQDPGLLKNGDTGTLVELYTSGGLEAGKYDYCDAFGNYSIPNVSSGSYRVLFSRSYYVDQWYNNKPDLTSSDLLSVSSDKTLNATLLSERASISGKVLGKRAGVTAAALDNVLVQAYDAETGLEEGYDYTDAMGNYSLVTDAKNTKLEFSKNGWVTEYYNDKSSLAAGAVLPLEPADALTGINATLNSEYATVKGKVLGKRAGETASPVENVLVQVYDASTGEELDYDYTDAYGNYEVDQILHGNVRIGFFQNNYIDQYWNNKPTLVGATTMSLAPAQLVANINPTLISKFGKIKGNVKGLAAMGATPVAVENVLVQAYDAVTGAEAEYDYTDRYGNYEITGIEQGDYKLKFEYGNATLWGPHWFDKKANLWTATRFHIAPAQLKTIDTTMYTPGVIYSATGQFSGPIAYELASFLTTRFTFKCDQPNVGAKLILKTASGDVVLVNKSATGNAANTTFSLLSWNGKVNGQRLPSASYTWVLVLNKNGHTATLTGKLLISKIVFTLSGTSANNVPVSKQAYMVPGSANCYVSASTSAASDNFKLKLSGPNGYNVNVGSWVLNSTKPLSVTGYVNGANAVRSRALHTWTMTGLHDVDYTVTVIQ